MTEPKLTCTEYCVRLDKDLNQTDEDYEYEVSVFDHGDINKITIQASIEKIRCYFINDELVDLYNNSCSFSVIRDLTKIREITKKILNKEYKNMKKISETYECNGICFDRKFDVETGEPYNQIHNLGVIKYLKGQLCDYQLTKFIA